jgi:hypothetical protein
LIGFEFSPGGYLTTQAVGVPLRRARTCSGAQLRGTAPIVDVCWSVVRGCRRSRGRKSVSQQALAS